MDEMPAKLKQRVERKIAKRDAKRREIASSAIEALKELGYANTSLRDIAEKSDLSLGMMHYYFEDRSELIIYCIRIYKLVFVQKIADALDSVGHSSQVIDTLSEAFVASIIDDKMIHRLWYDIRTQAMFDENFRPVVAEIEAMLIDVLRRVLVKSGHLNPVQVEIKYALVDGIFRFLMLNQITGTPLTREELLLEFKAHLTPILGPTTTDSGAS